MSNPNLTNVVRWNISGRDNTLHQELDIIRCIRVAQLTFVGKTNSMYGSALSVPSGKMLQLMRVDFMDTSATQSFGTIHLVDTFTGSSPIAITLHPHSYSIGHSIPYTDQYGPRQVFDFGPYGIPFSVVIGFMAHSKSYCDVTVFYIERDKIPAELG
jgi:hypothetical protein